MGNPRDSGMSEILVGATLIVGRNLSPPLCKKRVLMYLQKIGGDQNPKFLYVPAPLNSPTENREALHCDHDGMLLECIKAHLESKILVVFQSN
jgi:hypothetical protein